jgi:hypothetical protein
MWFDRLSTQKREPKLSFLCCHVKYGAVSKKDEDSDQSTLQRGVNLQPVYLYAHL